MSMARRFRAWAFAEKWFRTDFTSTSTLLIGHMRVQTGYNLFEITVSKSS
jgi:hypothetical protein